MVNALTRQAGFKLGPVILETLVKHYFERHAKENEEEKPGSTKLKREELLYDEAFNIIKTFLAASQKHTVEELQQFSNTRTPAPPWVHTVRLLVPMSCCDEAATYLINALGGEETTKRIVGGTKWWQVRGMKGVDAEWIAAKKDWEEAKKKQKTRRASMDGAQESSAEYKPEMDQMRCILYAHGGGYYFGSIDQERYSIQRFARKINGRVFTINYRLAPQYPFPCAIQDLLAAYIYLIRPPPGALHTPVAPENIVFGGDSAGGGLCISALQVIRDSGLPAPAGAILISPWCDLTHSFPSIHLNTATDVIPKWGLSFHKPSTLWPPPPDELTTKVHQSLRARIREAVAPKDKGKDKAGNLKIPKGDTDADPNGLPSRPSTPGYDVPVPSTGRTLHLGSAVSIPTLDAIDGVRSQRLEMKTSEGETLEIDRQIHMYTPNYLLNHPLVSPVLSYLGGLPPLLVIASDKEVLRDEVIYLAHKAAYPEQYPIREETRQLYAPLQGIESRYGPTKIHLQVYDGACIPPLPVSQFFSHPTTDCAHILPILFAFTTPGKYCFRAIATFIKYTTGMLPRPLSERSNILANAVETTSPTSTRLDLPGTASDQTPSTLASTIRRPQRPPPTALPTGNKSLRRTLSAGVTRAGSFLRKADGSNTSSLPSPLPSPGLPRPDASGSSDVGGPRFGKHHHSSGPHPGVRRAGEDSVYAHGLDTMIRERIATHGAVRALEPESELAAFKLPPEVIGDISELAVRRYMDATERFGKKFSKTTKAIEKARARNLERAQEDSAKTMEQLKQVFSAAAAGGSSPTTGDPGPNPNPTPKVILSSTGHWAWALDEDEHPPPSSIVSRWDTEEARRLAKIADQAVFMDPNAVSGNNLWSLIVNFLTTTPDRDAGRHGADQHDHARARTSRRHGSGSSSGGSRSDRDAAKAKETETERETEKASTRERFASRFAWLSAESRRSQSISTSPGSATPPPPPPKP
ncbi:alpha/beta-hydrolase [Epithele typhae]|uniref:alpha/beta-hydrolase n=1 Tax=Epithele typhae TaxID=378194 RepID=UPI00200880E4|nr:alpha/beta-hydrolase [Epithele typhae]KAH9942207.1 alpha/beta-hydrolase [Epithele typhae]